MCGVVVVPLRIPLAQAIGEIELIAMWQPRRRVGKQGSVLAAMTPS
jgi:hypothetical protein